MVGGVVEGPVAQAVLPQGQFEDGVFVGQGGRGGDDGGSGRGCLDGGPVVVVLLAQGLVGVVGHSGDDVLFACDECGAAGDQREGLFLLWFHDGEGCRGGFAVLPAVLRGEGLDGGGLVDG